MGIEDMRVYVPEAAVAVPAVSEWSVGKHIEHCSRATIYITRGLRESSLPAPRGKRSLVRWIVLTLGYIPRGRAQAPAQVRPEDDPTEARLLSLLEEAEHGADLARDLDPGAWFQHFALGVFNRDQALRFIDVHTHHHVKILRDILAAGNA